MITALVERIETAVELAASCDAVSRLGEIRAFCDDAAALAHAGELLLGGGRLAVDESGN